MEPGQHAHEQFGGREEYPSDDESVMHDTTHDPDSFMHSAGFETMPEGRYS